MCNLLPSIFLRVAVRRGRQFQAWAHKAARGINSNGVTDFVITPSGRHLETQENSRITKGYRTMLMELAKGNPTHQQHSSSPNLPSRFLRGVFLPELFDSGSVFISLRATPAKDSISDARSATSWLLSVVFVIHFRCGITSL